MVFEPGAQDPRDVPNLNVEQYARMKRARELWAQFEGGTTNNETVVVIERTMRVEVSVRTFAQNTKLGDELIEYMVGADTPAASEAIINRAEMGSIEDMLEDAEFGDIKVSGYRKPRMRPAEYVKDPPQYPTFNGDWTF
jgi:hypothetical protein